MAKPLYERTDDELLAFVSMLPVDDCNVYRRFRAQANMLLLESMGDVPTTTCGKAMFPLWPSHSMIGH